MCAPLAHTRHGCARCGRGRAASHHDAPPASGTSGPHSRPAFIAERGKCGSRRYQTSQGFPLDEETLKKHFEMRTVPSGKSP